MIKRRRILLGMLVCVGIFLTTRTAIDLDNRRIIRDTKPLYLYNPETQKLHITLNDVEVRCCGGCSQRGKFLGTYLNPAYQPFADEFQLRGQAPLCRVYTVDKN